MGKTCFLSKLANFPFFSSSVSLAFMPPKKPPTAAAGSFYAVAVGRSVGIYSNWDECKRQVDGFKAARYKKFSTQTEALDFIHKHNIAVSGLLEMHGAGGVAGGTVSTTTVTGSRKRKSLEKDDGEYIPQTSKARLAASSTSSSIVKQQGTSSTSSSPTIPPPAPPHTSHASISTAYDPQDQKTLLVAFCDGSSLGNGTRRARAGWGCIFPHNEAWNDSGRVSGTIQTNNRAEYLAALCAMKRANLFNPAKTLPLFIFTDSHLLIDSMTKWVTGWIKKGWKKSDGKAVLVNNME